MKGTHRAMAMEALTPGMEPNIVPAMIPRKIIKNVAGSSTMENPVATISNIYPPPLYSVSKNSDRSRNIPYPLGSGTCKNRENRMYSAAVDSAAVRSRIFQLRFPSSVI